MRRIFIATAKHSKYVLHLLVGASLLSVAVWTRASVCLGVNF